MSKVSSLFSAMCLGCLSCQPVPVEVIADVMSCISKCLVLNSGDQFCIV